MVYYKTMDTQFTPYLEQIEKELKAALPLLPDQSWKTASFGQLSPAVQEVHMAPLMSPTRTLVSLGGKRWRPLFLVLCAEAELEAQSANGTPASGNNNASEDSGKSSANSTPSLETAYHLTPLVEFVHTASLIHD